MKEKLLDPGSQHGSLTCTQKVPGTARLRAIIFLHYEKLSFKNETTIIYLSLLPFLQLDTLVAKISNTVENPELKELAKQVPQLVLKSRAENTTKKYNTYFCKWIAWCQTYSIKSMPAKDEHVALYLTSLVQNKVSPEVMESTFYAIEHFHKLNLLDSPFDTYLCTMIIEAAKREPKSRLKQKKEPITAEHIRKIFAIIGKESCSILNLRTFTMMVLSFAGFFRYSEVSELKCCDIEWHDTYIKLFVEKSKTDVYRDGHWLLIAKLQSPICPVKMLNLYISRTELNKNSEEHLFRAMTWLKKQNKHILKKQDKPISYSTARTNMLEMIDKIGLDKKLFGLHSLRAGGASAAANEGVPDRLFKRHGRWKSEKAKDGYVKDKLSELLSVSLSLGL